MTTSTLQVEIVPHREWPDAWVVEAIEFERDGAIEQAIFSGPNARERAQAHAQTAYGLNTPPQRQHDRHKSAA